MENKYVRLIKQATRLVSQHPELRAGQAYSIALGAIDNELYEAINGTECDPFYSNENLVKFFEKVVETWDKASEL
jgi:hypothetical protein